MSPLRRAWFAVVMLSTILAVACAEDLHTSPTPLCACTLYPEAASFGSKGGPGTFTVSIASDCAWSVAATADWITIVAGASGVGRGTVAYTVDPNPTRMERLGALIVGDAPMMITQAGSAVDWRDGNRPGAFQTRRVGGRGSN